MMGSPLMQENIWFDRLQVEEAEYKYYGHLANQHAGISVQTGTGKTSSLLDEIARARSNIQSSLNTGKGLKGDVTSRINALEKENQNLKQVTSELKALVSQLQARVTSLEEAAGVKTTPASALHKAPAPSKNQGEDEVDEDSDSDDDEDLFGDSEESQKKAEELKKKLQENSKKPKKKVIAKSNIVLDVKPFDDETDMADVEARVRAIAQDGLLWGAAKLVDVAFGIKKLQISCVVEDEKVSVDDLEEKIIAFEDVVQSVDIAAFNKI